MSGRKATTNIIPGLTALSVGMPNKKAPKGWTWVSLNSVAKMSTGHTPSRKHIEYWGGDIKWMAVGDARHFHGKTITKTKENTNELGIKKSAAVILPKGTVCLSRTGSIGYSVLLGEDMATSQGFVNWTCSDKILPRFLQLLFLTENSFLHTIAEGVAHTTIYFPEVKAFHVCLPNIDIQKRLIAKIETLFSELDNGIAQLKTAQQQLDIYRQSVLKWAFEGKLTNKNVKDGELPKGWEWVKLGDLSNKIGDGLHGTPLYDESGQCYFINGNNLSDGKIVFKTNTKKVSIQECNKYKKPLGVNSVLVSINGTIGNTAFYRGENIMLGKSACYINVSNQLAKEYLRLLLCSQYFINYAFTSATGSTIKNVPLKAIRQFKVPLPSIDEQSQVVEEIERRLSVADKLQETITTSLAQAESLRQSILKQAFEGRLV